MKKTILITISYENVSKIFLVDLSLLEDLYTLIQYYNGTAIESNSFTFPNFIGFNMTDLYLSSEKKSGFIKGTITRSFTTVCS